MNPPTVCYLWSVIMRNLSLFVILLNDASISTSETTEIQISYIVAKCVTTIARTRYLLIATLSEIQELTG